MTTYKEIQQFGSRNSDTENRLNRYEQYIYNNRTSEKVLSCTSHKLTKFDRTNCVAYHRFVNRSCGVRFEKGTTKEAIELWVHGDSLKAGKTELTIGKPTSQFKTLWFNHGRRK